MALDFSGQSLVGRSFVGQDLAGADFRLSDIRSANFFGANLSDANFQQARAGLSKRWQLVQILALLLCCTTIGVMAVIAGTFASTLLIQENIDKFTIVPGLLGLLMLASVSLPVIVQGFTPVAFQNLVITGSISIIAICIGTVFLSAPASSDSAGGITGGLVLLIAAAILLTVAGLTGGRLLIALCVGWLSAATIISYHITYHQAIAAITQLGDPGPYNRIGMVAFVIILLLSSTSIALRVLTRDEKFDSIQRLATTFTVQGGTSFHRANLTEADFTGAILKCTNFNSAQLIRTHFYRVQQLNTAYLTNTIFVSTPVRQLAISRNGKKQSYSKLNLTGINLTQANLIGSNFTDSTLSHAALQQAVATDANFTRVQAIGTQFQNAQLTGSCVEAWNIDSTTRLENVDCQYIYLRSLQQERRPSSGQFQAGEFTKLFQEVIETIDLIFQGGIDWKALHAMLNTANAERTKSEPLTLRSIENKNDGVVVVRVDSPANADKSLLHANLVDKYQDALQTLKASYQAQLQAKDEQITIYREQQANLSAIAQSLASRPVHLPTAPTTKLVHLKINSLENPTIILQIGEEGKVSFLECTGSLPNCTGSAALPENRIFFEYETWHSQYCRYVQIVSGQNRISAPLEQVTNISIPTLQQDLIQATAQFHHQFNQWLHAASFRPLKEKLLENLSPDESIRIVLQTDDRRLWQLPWHSWDLLSRYPKAELTLSTQHYKQTTGRRHPHSQVNILAILGSGETLDLEADYHLLEAIPDAKVTVLKEPSRETLNHQLWEKPWDVLFFAGHSHSRSEQAYLQINATEQLSLGELNHALRKACQQGLQLAIFNSCDGLGLVNSLSSLSLNQMIVMKEPVPDIVAQQFLKGLLLSFAKGQPLPQAVREAREKLQGIEDKFPCAVWLPVLCQTAATPPLTWQALKSE